MTDLNLDQYDQQKVVLVRNVTDDEGNVAAEEAEGTVLAVNPSGGILFKPKGRVSGILVMTDDIESIGFAPIKEKPIAVRYLREVKFGSTRQHLADRHGYTLDGDLAGMSEQDALAEHEAIDHEELSHRHGEKPEATEPEPVEESDDEYESEDED